MLLRVMGQDKTRQLNYQYLGSPKCLLNQFVIFKASLPVLPLTKVYSNVTKMMKTESKIERERRSLLKELFISLVERIVIDRQFPSSPNIPTSGYNLILKVANYLNEKSWCYHEASLHDQTAGLRYNGGPVVEKLLTPRVISDFTTIKWQTRLYVDCGVMPKENPP